VTDFCEYCGGPLGTRTKKVTVYRHRRGHHFIFESVPARVCPRCGERYFSAAVARRMDAQMKKGIAGIATVAVPVISLTGS
jgi:YgiT-type zinc finger domain-containing protein